ncbi:MAG: ATP-binding protein, partial [Cytophagaceae bacterium]
NGLSKYIPELDGFKTYHFESEKETHQDCNFILDIHEDSRGNLWLGTGNAGLLLFNRADNSYRFFNMKDDGLSDNSIKGIIEDNDGFLWLSTNNGVTRFNPKTFRAKAFTSADGVPASSFYSNSKYKDNDGKIYFGTTNGYVVIDPKLLKKNTQVPPVVITNFSVLRKYKDTTTIINLTSKYNAGKEIILPYNHNGLNFDFAVLNFNNPQKNRYAYLLEGFDLGWNYTNDIPRASYTNIDPGTYTFRVKGANNDNIWNNDGAWIRLTITPPWWKTWWFYTIMASSSILLFFGLIKWRVYHERKKNVQLEEVVRIRTKALKESNEQLDAFVYKASHDIKGPLKSIIGLTTIGQKDVKDPSAQHYFDHILKSTKKLDKLLMDLLELTKVKQASVKAEPVQISVLINEAIDSFRHFPDFEKIKITQNINETIEFCSDRNLLYSILQNLVENPIKYYDHEKSDNFLDIKINVTKKEAVFIFKDNGIGIPEELQEKVFDMFYKIGHGTTGTGLGLYIVKTTVDKLNGKINLQSKIKEGCTFTVVVPNLANPLN